MSELNRLGKMNDEHYRNLPEGVGAVLLAPLVLECVADSVRESPAVTVAKLKELGDRQWHTYELPSDAVRSAVQKWVIHQSTTDCGPFLEELLAIAYCFAFEKAEFHRLLEQYEGGHRTEFEDDLRHSPGVYIDPWWSLRKNPQR